MSQQNLLAFWGAKQKANSWELSNCPTDDDSSKEKKTAQVGNVQLYESSLVDPVNLVSSSAETIPRPKKARQFNLMTFRKWKGTFNWLEEESGNLYCSICRRNGNANQTSFVKGCSTFKLEAVSQSFLSIIFSEIFII